MQMYFFLLIRELSLYTTNNVINQSPTIGNVRCPLAVAMASTPAVRKIPVWLKQRHSNSSLHQPEQERTAFAGIIIDYVARSPTKRPFTSTILYFLKPLTFVTWQIPWCGGLIVCIYHYRVLYASQNLYVSTFNFNFSLAKPKNLPHPQAAPSPFLLSLVLDECIVCVLLGKNRLFFYLYLFPYFFNFVDKISLPSL